MALILQGKWISGSVSIATATVCDQGLGTPCSVANAQTLLTVDVII